MDLETGLNNKANLSLRLSECLSRVCMDSGSPPPENSKIFLLPSLQYFVALLVLQGAIDENCFSCWYPNEELDGSCAFAQGLSFKSKDPSERTGGRTFNDEFDCSLPRGIIAATVPVAKPVSYFLEIRSCELPNRPRFAHVGWSWLSSVAHVSYLASGCTSLGNPGFQEQLVTKETVSKICIHFLPQWSIIWRLTLFTLSLKCLTRY